MADNTDALDGILQVARLRLAGLHEVRHPKTGALLSIFPHVPFYNAQDPRQRALAEAWEERTLAMYARQGRLGPEDLPEKGEDRRGPAFDGLKRGD